MSQFDNVTILKKANIYYDGKVTSRVVIFPDGEMKTLGIMMPGNYEFGTEKKEIMEIQSGKLEVQLPGGPEWIKIDGQHTFEVPADSKFRLIVEEVTDYCCSYVDQ